MNADRLLIIRLVVVWVLTCALVGCSWGPGARRELSTISGRTMGTDYTVKLINMPSDTDADSLKSEIDARLAEINRQMSLFDPHSELSQFNAYAKTGWFAVSRPLANILIQAHAISTLTQGAFDVSVAPLVKLWGFGPKKKLDAPDDRIPDDDLIQKSLRDVGYRHLHVRTDPPAVKKERPALQIDLGAIAKGYGVDKIAGYIESRGIADYMVEIGGEVKARGHNARGEPWHIAIETPRAGARGEFHRIIPLNNMALATSGDYRNYFEKDGARYTHIIDPNTGRPITHRLASVTVIDDASCARADALATGLFVLGLEKAYETALRNNLAVFLIIKSDDGFVEKSTPLFDTLTR